MFKRLALLCAVMLFALPTVALACTEGYDWERYSGGYRNDSTYRYADSTTEVWALDIAGAENDWYYSAANAKTRYNSSSANTVMVHGDGSMHLSGNYGLYTPRTNIFGTVVGFDIKVDEYAITMDGLTEAAVQNVIAHEFGHSFSLGDLDPPNQASGQLMSHDRDRDTQVGPQSCDIVGVNTIYPTSPKP